MPLPCFLQVLQRRASSSSSSFEVVEADAQVELVDAEPAKLPDLSGTWIKVRCWGSSSVSQQQLQRWQADVTPKGHVEAPEQRFWLAIAVQIQQQLRQADVNVMIEVQALGQS
jgi:hypothetical protein